MYQVGKKFKVMQESGTLSYSNKRQYTRVANWLKYEVLTIHFDTMWDTIKFSCVLNQGFLKDLCKQNITYFKTTFANHTAWFHHKCIQFLVSNVQVVDQNINKIGPSQVTGIL